MSTKLVVAVESPDEGACTVNMTHGATITSLHITGEELMARGFKPQTVLTRDSGFEDSGLIGWVECFPSIAAQPDPDRPIADHGELWFREWAVTGQAPGELRLQCHLPEWDVVASKRVGWSGGALEVSTSLSLAGGESLHYVLASHPLLACDDTMWLRLGDSDVRWESSSGWSQQPRRLNDAWPADEDGRRWWRDLPEGSFAKVFVPWPETGVTFGYADGAWTMDWADAPPLAFLGLWLNKLAFPSESPLCHWAPEPTIGSADSLSMAEELGTHGVLQPGDSVTMTVRISPA
jgi:hypothetical protein